MKQENKKLLLVGAGVIGTLCAIAAIKKLKEKPREPEYGDYDDDFDEPFFDDDLDPDYVPSMGSIDIHFHMKEENDE